MIARLDRLEAGQDQIAAALLGMQQQPTTSDRIRGQRRRSLRPCYMRFRSAFVRAKGRLLEGTDSWLSSRPDLARAYALLAASRCGRICAWILEMDTSPVHRERNAADAAAFRRDADWYKETARRILECRKDGGDMGAVMDEYDEGLKNRASHNYRRGDRCLGVGCEKADERFKNYGRGRRLGVGGGEADERFKNYGRGRRLGVGGG